MRKLGKIVSIEDNKLVLRTDENILKVREKVEAGDSVYDESKRHIGEIVNFKEKNDKIYPLISPKKDPEPLVGKKVYG